MTDRSAEDHSISDAVEGAATGTDDGEWSNGHSADSSDSSGHRRALEMLSGRVMDEETPTVLLLLTSKRNRQLLTDFLTTEVAVTLTTDIDALDGEVDLCIVDRTHLDSHRGAIVARREAVDPVFLPVLLFDSGARPLDPETLMVVDEVVQTPISKPILRTRLQNSLARRRQSCQLAQRESELEAALTELRVRDRAMAEAPIGVTIAGPREDDTPIVYANDAFIALTGYDRADILGRNCRFLQGDRTDDATVRELRAALDDAEPVSVDLVNYTRTGEQFWNKVDIAPVRDDTGEVTHFIGFQTDITARKLHEQRVDVLNRFMRHNLRNELNIIDGYLNALTTDVGVDRDTALERISESTTRLVGLSEEVGHIEQVFSGRPSTTDIKPVSAVVDEVRNGMTKRHPDVTVHVEAPTEEVSVSAKTLSLGCVDYLSALLGTNGGDGADQQVSVVATVDHGIVDIALCDNSGGLLESDWRIVESGAETPLQHTDHLGLWVLRWVTTTNGGQLSRTAEGGGTLHVCLPIRDLPPD